MQQSIAISRATCSKRPLPSRLGLGGSAREGLKAFHASGVYTPPATRSIHLPALLATPVLTPECLRRFAPSEPDRGRKQPSLFDDSRGRDTFRGYTIHTHLPPE